MSFAERRKGTPTGIWFGERVVQGHRLRRRFRQKEDADQWEATIDATGALPADERPYVPYPLSYIAREAKKGRWQNSVHDDNGPKIELILEHFGAECAVEEITTEAINQFVEVLKKRKARGGTRSLSPKSVNRYLAALSALLSYSRAQRWSYHCPTFPWQPEPTIPIRPLSLYDEQRFLDALNNRVDRIIAETFLQTGLHSSEMFNLKPEHIELDSEDLGMLSVGVGKKARQVALHIGLARQLKDIVAAKQLPNGREFYRSVKDAFKSIGLDDGYSVRSLRQTAIVRVGRLVPAQIAQSFAGHSDSKTTQRYLLPPTQTEAEAATNPPDGETNNQQIHH